MDSTKSDADHGTEAHHSTAHAIEFLQHWHGNAPWLLCAIVPDGKLTSHLAHPGQEAAAAKWIEAAQGKANLYFHVNRTRPSLTRGHAKKEDIELEIALHVDVDPRDGEEITAERSRILSALQAYDPPPSVIIDSGGGYGGFWLLREPVNDLTGVESRNRHLELKLGGDHCRDVSRLMRLPGTVNLPNKKKRAKGRVVSYSSIVEAHWDRRYSLDEFAEAEEELPKPKPPKPPKPDDNQNPGDLDALPPDLRELIVSGDASKWKGDRSKLVWFIACALVHEGWTDDQIRTLLLDPAYGVSAHVREQSDPSKYAERQATQARANVAKSTIGKMNDAYAIVLVGGKAAVMKVGVTPEGRPDMTLMTPGTLAHWLSNQKVKVRGRSVPISKYWMEHPERRQYEGMTFSPGRTVPNWYNLWRGFSVTPRPGDCSKFLAHVRENACGGDEVLYRWTIGWFADLVQHLAQKNGTSLVFKGEEGTGKTKIGEVIGSLFSDHYLLVADSRYVTGRFNSHIVSCLLLHADEAFFAGDHAAASKVKDLITGNHHLVEFKGYEPLRIRNYVRLLITGNANWVVPVGMEGRRFAVYEMSTAHMQDHPYFAAIDAEMDNGGREALLHHLLNFDLSGIDLRTVPKTAALLDQKFASLTPIQGWWLDVLNSGRLPAGCGEAGVTPTRFLFDQYIIHAQKRGAPRRSIETIVGRALGEFVPGLRKAKRTYALPDRNSEKREEAGVYEFPPLTECRAEFARQLMQDVTWGEPTEWVEDPVDNAPF